MKSKLMILVMTALILPWAHSHEGHHHGAEGVKPQKGGVLQTLETIHLELVQMNKEVRVYVFSKDKPPKPLPTKSYPVSARVVYPRGKGESKVELTAKKDHWSATVDSKGMHRYDFILNIEQGGHKDDVKFTIEPK